MKTYRAGPAQLRVGEPVQVAEGIGHLWFPVVHKFGCGELIASWSMMPDLHCFAYLAGASHSTDGGKRWSTPYSLGNFANQCLSLPDGSLRRIPYYIYPHPPGQRREFATDLTDVRPGGAYQTKPFGARITGFARDVALRATGAAAMNFTGTSVAVGDEWLTTIYGCWQDEIELGWRHNLLVLSTNDHGLSWRYVSTISTHHDTPDVSPVEGQQPEGPCEASLAMLDDGELLCVYRVGNAEKWPYRCARSRDGGRTWGTPQVMSGIGRVEPSLCRLSSGVLALSGGRPGLKLWLSDDGKGGSWQPFDILAHHNETSPPEWRMAADGSQTTAYTELVEVEPNRLLYIYDRCPFGWRSAERNRIFVVSVDVTRV